MTARIFRIAIVALLLAVFTVPTSLFAQEAQGTHTVQPGENLYRIALRYGVDLNELANLNNITNQSRIFSGQVLVIPGLSAPDSGEEIVNPLIAGTPISHIVQPGDSLTIIANQYGITVNEILQANNIANPNHIERGQELQIWTAETVSDEVKVAVDAIPEDTPAELIEGVPPENNITYLVQEGETLGSIALRYGISWQTLAAVNGISNADQVFAGQEIVIPAVDANGTAVEEMLALASNSPQPTVTVGKQIIVDLSDSTVYAYEDGQLVHSAVASMGLPATPTVQGDFNIYHRLDSQTMSGPGYYLPGVEWVQYFYQGYAIHGTYWHNNFGQPMSHGCVNLPNNEALWFYNFAEMGTPVRVQA